MSTQNNNIQVPKKKEREVMFYIALGMKGIGKTYQTTLVIERYWRYGNPSVGAKPRKVIIFDVNNEYTNYKEIACDRLTIQKWMAHPLIECRRVASKKPDGKTKSDVDFQNDLSVILDEAYSCLLVLEDLSLFVGDATSNKLIGRLCTNRHKDMDIITHFQYISKAGHPKFKPLCSILRMHKTGDSCVKGGEKRFGGDYPKIRIAEIILNNRFYLGVSQIELLEQKGIYKGNKDYDNWENNYRRFFLYVDLDKHKIKGNFTKQEFMDACEAYLQENIKTEINPLLAMKDMKTGKAKYSYLSAFEQKVKELMSYYGNASN